MDLSFRLVRAKSENYPASIVKVEADGGGQRGASATFAVTQLHLTQWRRSRAPITLMVLAAVLCCYDYASRPTRDYWWLLVTAVEWSAFVVSYDAFERYRADGSLRTLLLRGSSPRSLAVGFAFACVLVALCTLPVAFLYLALVQHRDIDFLAAVAMLISTIGLVGWVIYGLLLSLVLPRDATALLGVLLIVFGRAHPDTWLQSDAYYSAKLAVAALWYAIPAGARLEDVLHGRHVLLYGSIQLLQIACAFAIVERLLSRQALLKRHRSEW